MLNNLVANAIKYSPSGGPVTIEVAPKDDGALVTVRDQGIGIAPNQLDAIFGLFYRSPDRAARDVAGMGLGLYISREIVDRHGGQIWAESTPDQGSAFHVALRRVPAEAPEPAGQAAPPTAARTK